MLNEWCIQLSCFTRYSTAATIIIQPHTIASRFTTHLCPKSMYLPWEQCIVLLNLVSSLCLVNDVEIKDYFNEAFGNHSSLYQTPIFLSWASPCKGDYIIERVSIYECCDKRKQRERERIHCVLNKGCNKSPPFLLCFRLVNDFAIYTRSFCDLAL